MPPGLQIRHLCVSYHPAAAGQPVLRDLALAIQAGEAVGIHGRSGSGKTTLARAIPRLLPAAAHVSGHIEHNGSDLLRLPVDQMRRIRGRAIAYIPQEPSVALNPMFTAGRQVEEVLRAHRALNAAALRAESLGLLERFFAGPRARRVAASFPHQLSGGERQRVVICQAIAAGPSLLIADEPASALDSIAQREFLDLLKDLRRELALSLLLVSHHRPALRYATERCLELKDGALPA